MAEPLVDVLANVNDAITLPQITPKQNPLSLFLRKIFTARQFALDGFAHKVSPVLTIVQHSLNARERPFREARLHIFRPSFLPAHAIALRRIRNFCQISHMRYCPDK